MHRGGEEITRGVQQQSWAHIRSISKPEGKTIEITQMQNVKEYGKVRRACGIRPNVTIYAL